MKVRKIFLFACLLFLIFFSDSSFYPKPQTWPPIPTFYPKLSEDSPELVNADYDDYRQHRSFWKVYVPDWFGKIIANQIAMMHYAGCFGDFCEQDFDHGHLLLCGTPKLLYDSPESFFRDVVMVLYHTNALNGRWQKEKQANKPLAERTPHSLLGFANGMVRPAKDAISMSQMFLEIYEDTGRIDSYTVGEALNLFCDASALKILIRGKNYIPAFTIPISIKPHLQGRYVVGGQRFDAFVRFQENHTK